MTDKESELLNKIKALAEHGVGGEKINAQKKLEELMKKLDITTEDLENNDLQIFRFKYKQGKELKTLMLAILMNYFDVDKLDCFYYSGRNEIAVGKISPSDAVEIKARYDFYSDAYSKDLKIFFRAFIEKNELYDCRPSNVLIGKMSKKDKEFYKASARLRESLEAHEYRLKIENHR